MDNKIAQVIEELLYYAGQNLDFYYENTTFCRNQLLDLLKVDEPAEIACDKNRPLQELLDIAVSYAIEKKLCKNEEALQFETRIMSFLTPSPYQVITTFEDLAILNTKNATDYLNKLSINSNYIRMADIDKNLQWKVERPEGDLMITINLAKPEKDPKQIEL
ncbi:MAG: galactose-1-phosphate uridylyltransferase, partial [Clostridia bacterium]